MKYYKNILSAVLMTILAVFSSYGMEPGEVTLAEHLRAKALGQIVNQQAPTNFSDKTQPLSERIENLRDAKLQPTEKKQILKTLAIEHKNTPRPQPTMENTRFAPKKPSQFRMALAEWFKTDSLLRVLKTSLSNPIPPHLPSMSAQNLNNDLDGLSQSSLFDGNDVQDLQENSYSIFKSVAHSLPNQLNVLLNKEDQRKLMRTKMDIVNGLNSMTTFIYDYDLNPKEEDALHESERCWLLELIKNTILDNNTFTPEMIADWQDQINNIAIVTEKSRSSKKLGDLFLGSVLELAQQKVKTDQEKNKKEKSTKKVRVLSEKDKAEKQRLKKTIDKSAQEMEQNVYDPKFLSPYLTDLKKYKSLLSPITEQEERKEISQLIRITARKLKAIAIITPRKKPLEQTIKSVLTRYENELKSPQFHTTKNLSEGVTALQGYLATDKDYDALKVIMDINSDLYKNIITTLRNYTWLLNETAQFKKDMKELIEPGHFEQLASEIEKLQYLLKSDPENPQIQQMISSYENRIQNDTDVLINQIKTGSILLEESLATDYFGDHIVLSPYRSQVIKAIKEKMKTQQQEIEAAMKAAIQHENDFQMAQNLQNQEYDLGNRDVIPNNPPLGQQEEDIMRGLIPNIVNDDQNNNPPVNAGNLAAVQPIPLPQPAPAAPPVVPPAPLLTRIGTYLWSVGETIVSKIGAGLNWIRSLLPW